MPTRDEHGTDVRDGASRGDAPSGGTGTTIVVNRRRVKLPAGGTNHAHLVGLAHPGVAMAEARSFTVAFSRGGRSRPEGFVAPGERIDVVDGQEFHVAVAERS